MTDDADLDEDLPLKLVLCRKCSACHTWEKSGICIRCRLEESGLL